MVLVSSHANIDGLFKNIKLRRLSLLERLGNIFPRYYCIAWYIAIKYNKYKNIPSQAYGEIFKLAHHGVNAVSCALIGQPVM